MTRITRISLAASLVALFVVFLLACSKTTNKNDPPIRHTNVYFVAEYCFSFIAYTPEEPLFVNFRFDSNVTEPYVLFPRIVISGNEKLIKFGFGTLYVKDLEH